MVVLSFSSMVLVRIVRSVGELRTCSVDKGFDAIDSQDCCPGRSRSVRIDTATPSD